MLHLRTLRSGILGLMLTLVTTLAGAQPYPSKPVRLIIPFPPGASNDIVGRMIATQLSEKLGKPVVVDNRGGAGGLIGTEAAANSLPDGYTLLLVSLGYAFNASLYKLPYDPATAFAPVALLGAGPVVLVVNSKLPVNSVKELLALAKEKPGQLHYVSGGIGSFQHLTGALFKLQSGADIVHVPFKGAAPAMMDVVAGNTEIAIGTIILMLPQIKAGRLKALGGGSTKRPAFLPDVPTIGEAGVPGTLPLSGVRLDLGGYLQRAHVAVQRDREGERRFLPRRVRAGDADERERKLFRLEHLRQHVGARPLDVGLGGLGLESRLDAQRRLVHRQARKCDVQVGTAFTGREVARDVVARDDGVVAEARERPGRGPFDHHQRRGGA